MEVSTFFQQQYGKPPALVVEAPGRGNLIGEHTDYNQGFVMPFPLNRTVKTAIAINEDNSVGMLRLSSTMNEDIYEIHHKEAPKKQWTDYVIGCIQILAEEKAITIPALDIAVDSNVPLGAGVSSSAALEVSCLRALNELFSLNLSAVEIAQLGQKAENNYVGMPCGIMDQMASSVAEIGQALLIDTRDLSYQNVTIPKGYIVAVVPSGVSHALVDGAYEALRKQCEEAAKKLSVSSLRDVSVSDMDKINDLPEPLNQRAKHVVTENQRVLDMKKALDENDMIRAGRILTEGHISERDDFEITVSETDILVEDMVKLGALGARQIGGGFGGSCIALLKEEQLETWWKKLSKAHPKVSLID